MGLKWGQRQQFVSGLKFYILLLTFSLRLSLKVNELSDDYRNRHTGGTVQQTRKTLAISSSDTIKKRRLRNHNSRKD